jgi:hypothetical protein
MRHVISTRYDDLELPADDLVDDDLAPLARLQANRIVACEVLTPANLCFRLCVFLPRHACPAWDVSFTL